MDEQTSGSMGPLAEEVADVMRRCSTLADAILRTQCRLNGCSTESMKLEDLETLIPLLRDAVGRFTSPTKANNLQADLLVLLRSRSRLPAVAVESPFSVLQEPSYKSKPASLADKVLEILGECTPFAGQIFSAQCKSIGVNPGTIRPEDLDELIPRLCARVGQWTSSAKGESVERQLRRLRRKSRNAQRPDATGVTEVQ